MGYISLPQEAIVAEVEDCLVRKKRANGKWGQSTKLQIPLSVNPKFIQFSKTELPSGNQVSCGEHFTIKPQPTWLWYRGPSLPQSLTCLYQAIYLQESTGETAYPSIHVKHRCGWHPHGTSLGVCTSWCHHIETLLAGGEYADPLRHHHHPIQECTDGNFKSCVHLVQDCLLYLPPNVEGFSKYGKIGLEI